MRRILTVLAAVAMLVPAAVPAGATSVFLDGPNPAFWLSNPDGPIEGGDPIPGASGWVRVDRDGAKIKLRASGLEPGHAYTLWVIYFNDQTLCVDGCDATDLVAAGGGAIYGDGKLASPSGKAVFTATIGNGSGAEVLGAFPTIPFAVAPYQSGMNNEFHLAIRSHGPAVAGVLHEQLSSYAGGCLVDIGPPPGLFGDYPVPSQPGECGDIQVYIFR